MKLSYVTNLRIPSIKANSVQVMQNCEAFKKAGVHVTLFTPFRFREKKEDKIKDMWEYYSIDKKFPVRRIFSVDLFPFRTLEHLAFWIQSFSFYLSVAFRFLFWRSDVIYTRDAWLGLALFYKRKKVLELHNFPQSKLGKAIYRFLIKRFWKVVVISEGLHKEVPGSLIAPDGVKLESFDIDIDRDGARKKLDIPLGEKIIMYVGSLQKWKGITNLIEAAKKLKDSKLYVVGSSLDKKDLKDLSAGENIVFTGHIPHKDVPYYLKAADALVIPNTRESAISSMYTSPLKAFEYMAADRPIVVCNLPSMLEIFDEKNSYIFEAGNSDDLARAIKEALSDGNKRCNPKEYSWDTRTKKILKFISS